MEQEVGRNCPKCTSLSRITRFLGYIQNGTADVAAACALVTTAAASSALGAKAAQFVSAKVLSRSLAVVMLAAIPVILARDTASGASRPVVDPDGFGSLRRELNALLDEGLHSCLSRTIEYLKENVHLLGVGVLTGFSSGALGKAHSMCFVGFCLGL